MVTEQIANLSAGNRRPGSNPGLSADVKASAKALAFFHCTQNNFNYLCPRLQRSGRGLVRLRRLVWDQEIAGSNPAAPTAQTLGHQTGCFCLCQVRYVPFMSRWRLAGLSVLVPLWVVVEISEFQKRWNTSTSPRLSSTRANRSPICRASTNIA